MTDSLDSLNSNINFNLLSWFSFLGLLAIVLISIGTSYLLSHFLEEQLVKRDATVLKDFVIKMSQTHDPSAYFSSSYIQDGTQLNDFFEDIAHMPDVARINAYSTNNVIVWSSDSAMVGQHFPGNHELEEALEGQLIYEKVDIRKLEKPEHILLAAGLDWFIENYIPVRDPVSQQIVGVVEIYRIPVELSRAIKHSKKLVWSCISVGSMLLFLILFGILRRSHQLIRSQQQALLSQMRITTIGEMTSSIALSIRNPIASIRASAELANDTRTSHDISENMEDIISEVDRLDAWAKELLTFTSDAGDPDASADVSKVIMICMNNISSKIERLGINVHTTLPENELFVRSDPTLLVQVLNSLTANALDAMPHGGQLIIEVSTAGTDVHITLSDTGFGIPADKLENVFDPMVTQKNSGLGIGLAVARQIVQRYGGSININSTVGSGTNVTVILPLK